jgi:hypothetical protein
MKPSLARFGGVKRWAPGSDAVSTRPRSALKSEAPKTVPLDRTAKRAAREQAE